MVREYVAVLEQSADGFCVFFPDVPGCTSAGDTAAETAVNAEEALRAHLLLTLEYGETIPEPRRSEDIPLDPEVPEAARILVHFDAEETEQGHRGRIS